MTRHKLWRFKQEEFATPHPALSFSINFDFRQDYYIMTKSAHFASAYFFVHQHYFEEVCVKQLNRNIKYLLKMFNLLMEGFTIIWGN